MNTLIHTKTYINNPVNKINKGLLATTLKLNIAIYNFQWHVSEMNKSS